MLTWQGGAWGMARIYVITRVGATATARNPQAGVRGDDGLFIGYKSAATNLVEGDGDNMTGAFMTRLQEGTTALTATRLASRHGPGWERYAAVLVGSTAALW